MEKIALLEKYEKMNKSDFIGLSVERDGFLHLAIISKSDAVNVLNAVTGGIENGSKGNGVRVRYNMTAKHTALIEHYAIKAYRLPFTVADIENAYKTEKASNNGKQGKQNRGVLFEDWTANALNAERNTQQNRAFTDGGDLRIDGMDVQIKYDRGAVALPL